MADHAADIHAAITLTVSALTVTTAITAPSCPRVLSVTGSAVGVVGNVVIVGTDWTGAALTDTIAADGTHAVFGSVAFKTVASIAVPIGSGTISVGVQDRLYTVHEARAFRDAGIYPLADSATYPDADILAAEEYVRRRFEAALRTALLPTQAIDMLDAVASSTLCVSGKNPAHESPRKPLTVTAANIGGVALTAPELGCVKAHGSGRVVRTDGGSWADSVTYPDLAVLITYWHGWSTVPELAKRAALLYTVRTLAQGEIPLGGRDYTDTGPPARFPYPGKRPHWTGDDEVDAILSELEEDTVVVA